MKKNKSVEFSEISSTKDILQVILSDQDAGLSSPASERNFVSNVDSPNSYGYENLFQVKDSYNPLDQQLNDLAESMTAKADPSDCGIPSGYTYLSQFIAHDVSLDSENLTLPWKPILSSTITNQRSPFFDLETLYGFNQSH